MIEYKFNEGDLIQEVKDYVDATYDEHYATGKIQATESIIDDGHGTGFCMGNVGKYGRRYGKKGETPAEWRKDLMKVIHYSLIQLFIHDKQHGPAMSRDDAYQHITTSAPGHYNGQISAPKGTAARLNDVSPDEWDRVNRVKGAPLCG